MAEAVEAFILDGGIKMDNVFWAAFGGGAAAGLLTLIAVGFAEWLRWFIDRPLAKVKLSLGFITGDTTRQVFYEAANPHSKSVTLSTFGILFKRKQMGTLFTTPQLGYQFPYQLDGGKSIQQWASVQNLLETLKKGNNTPGDLKWVYFNASSGKTYRGKIEKWVIAELEKAFDKLASANGS